MELPVPEILIAIGLLIAVGFIVFCARRTIQRMRREKVNLPLTFAIYVVLIALFFGISWLGQCVLDYGVLHGIAWVKYVGFAICLAFSAWAYGGIVMMVLNPLFYIWKAVRGTSDKESVLRERKY